MGIHKFQIHQHIYIFVNCVGNNYKFTSNGIYSQPSYFDIILIILSDVSNILGKPHYSNDYPFPKITLSRNHDDYH